MRFESCCSFISPASCHNHLKLLFTFSDSDDAHEETIIRKRNKLSEEDRHEILHYESSGDEYQPSEEESTSSESGPGSDSYEEEQETSAPSVRERRKKKRKTKEVMSTGVKVEAFFCPVGSCEYSSHGRKNGFGRPDVCKRHLKRKHAELYGPGGTKARDLPNLFSNRRGPRRVHLCHRCNKETTNLTHHRKICEKKKRAILEVIKQSLVETESHPDLGEQEEEETNDQKAKFFRITDDFNNYLVDTRHLRKNTARNYKLAMSAFFRFNEAHCADFSTKKVLQFRQNLPPLSVYANHESVKPLQKKMAYYAYCLFTGYLRVKLAEKGTNRLQPEAIESMVKHLKEMHTLAELVGPGYVKMAEAHSSLNRYDMIKAGKSLKLKPNLVLQMMTQFLNSKWVNNRMQEYLDKTSLDNEPPNRIRNFLEALILVSCMGQRSDVIRNITKDEFLFGSDNGKDGKERIRTCLVYEHKTMHSKTGAASLPIVGDELITLMFRYITEVRPKTLPDVVDLNTVETPVTEENEGKLPIFLTNQRKKETRADGALQVIRDVLREEFHYKEELCSHVTAHVFRYAICHWTAESSDPKVAQIASRAMSHGYNIHATTYNVAWGKSRSEFFEEYTSKLREGKATCKGDADDEEEPAEQEEDGEREEATNSQEGIDQEKRKDRKKGQTTQENSKKQVRQTFCQEERDLLCKHFLKDGRISLNTAFLNLAMEQDQEVKMLFERTLALKNGKHRAALAAFRSCVDAVLQKQNKMNK